MRGKAGHGPRTMGQKVLAAHCPSVGGTGRSPSLVRTDSSDELIEVRVDQVILAREPNTVLGQAACAGLSRTQVEVSVAYPPHCVATCAEEIDPRSPLVVPRDALSLGFLIAEPGAGFAPFVHLERFGSPGRLALTDEPRLSNTGSIGMLTLLASPGRIVEALQTGTALVRRPRSVQVLLKGRLRPFVCARDASLHLLREGLAETVRRVDGEHRAPVVLEFGGPGAKFLSVMDRAVLCSIAPRIGAAAALFSADEKTEVFLRDQKRSKAQRALFADAGAPFDDVVSMDLTAVDPLVMDEAGRIRTVRELEGKEVAQVLLGGDSGTTLRDIMGTAALLKSKRVPPGIEFLLATPSRQCLEVLARSGALADLIATGARMVEPDRRALTGEFYPPRTEGLALQNADPENAEGAAPAFIASAETLAYAVAYGVVGDPRGFKRPARLTLPRNLPTDDVLIARGAAMSGVARGKGRIDKKARSISERPTSNALAAPRRLEQSQGQAILQVVSRRAAADQPSVLVTDLPEEVRWLAENRSRYPELRAVVALHIPAATVWVLSGNGVLALEADHPTLDRLVRSKTLAIPDPQTWDGGSIELDLGGEPAVRVQWLARGAEREWASSRSRSH